MKNTRVILQVILNRNSTEELQWWIQKFENLQWSLLDSVSQSSADTDRRIQKGLGVQYVKRYQQGDLVKGGTVITHKCVRTEISKISTFDLQQTKIFENGSFTNRQHHCTTLPSENGGKGEQMLLKLSKEIWQYLSKHQITITAEYLPSFLNVGADWQSQNSRDPSEWTLCQKYLNKSARRGERPK